MKKCLHRVADAQWWSLDGPKSVIVGYTAGRARGNLLFSAKCSSCRAQLSIGRSNDRSSVVQEAILAANVAATARDGAIGVDDRGEEPRSWPPGVEMGWSMHEDAISAHQKYPLDESMMMSRWRRVGFLARQIYVHAADTSSTRLSLAGQISFMRALEKYGCR